MAKIVRRVRGGRVGTAARSLRSFDVVPGLPNPTAIASELQDMTDVLLGRTAPPMDKGILTLMEVADAYFARATEMERLILGAEREGKLAKGSAYSKLRTLEIRSFKEMAKSATDLGSRRLTAESLIFEQETRGREM